MNKVLTFANFVGAMVVGFLLAKLGVLDFVDRTPGNFAEPNLSMPTYLGFLSVMLTAVTVVLAAVAIGIGVVAAYTIREIKSEAISTARATAQATADTALSEDVIRDRIYELSLSDKGAVTVGELEEGFDPSDTGDR